MRLHLVRISLTLLLLAIPSGLLANMSNYCSAPPYVTRHVAPNIMILMDNSQDMLGPAFGNTYSPNASVDNYIGFFKRTGCYQYSAGKFTEVLNTSVVPNRTYTAGETCPSTAPFRGNLLNWATMSKYDVLQKVLIGGNTVSKQGNAHTLLSISGAWSPRTYSGCTFTVNNGNLSIVDETAGSCTLLNSPKTPIALSPLRIFWDMFSRGAQMIYSVVAGGAHDVASVVVWAWDQIDLVSKAWAAALTLNINTGSLNGTVDVPYSITLEGGGDNNTDYYWATTPSPPVSWLSGPTYTSSGNKTNYLATWKGTPTVAGNYTFSVTLTDRDGNTPATRNFTINVASPPLKINTNALPNGQVGDSYWFELNGQGGTPPLNWTASGLPAGLSLGTYTSGTKTFYVISGTPTAAGTSSVILTLWDGAAFGSSTSVALPLTIDASLVIATNTLPMGEDGSPYSATLTAVGGTTPYTWSITAGSLPPGVTMDASGVFSGTIAAGSTGSYPLTIRLQDAAGRAVTKNMTLAVVGGVGHVQILSTSPLPTAYKGLPYTYQMVASGGSQPYTWAIASGAPVGAPGMTIDPVTGVISWIPTNTVDTTYPNIVIEVTGGGGYVDQKTFSITSMRAAPTGKRSSSFTVKVDLIEEPLVDLNGNDIWDLGETFTDSNGNGVWDGKQGIFQKFWSTTKPRARWGMTKFMQQGASTITDVNTCIPASPASSFYTAIQNATATPSSPLAKGLYGDIQYYGFNSPYGSGFSGCSNSDPIDNVPCRKNFVLIISSGADVSGTSFAATAACNEAAPLVQNACVGYKTDLRSDKSGKQNVYTYVVNTMGTANNATLQAAALAGGGKYYDASDSANLEAQLTTALTDILAQAASGTAVSVLTTSSRGIGSMVQSYFLPVRQEGAKEVLWTGYTQNLWIDSKDNLREDTVNDYKLKFADDKVIKLFFDTSTNETKVASFSTLADGTGGTLAACTATAGDIKPFSQTGYLWETGKKLALKDHSSRNIITAKKVIKGTTDTHSFATNTFTAANVTGNASMSAALDADALYSAANIVNYVRGEAIEASDSNFRDRRVTVDGTLRVWKLGDVISSTPKVFANTPVNTYHIDYGDSTYHSYVASDSYKQRSSIAFVGANDGMLHAFRVGYLKDKELETGVRALFKNLFSSSDSDNDQLGNEVWGYVPFNAFPYLKYLANPGYCHLYFNDLSVRLVDASLGGDSNPNPSDTRSTESWKTILIGGMRFGGACEGGTPTPPGSVSNVGYSAYYAIDITDPENPVPLWEFSDPDMGYATTFPSIVRTGPKNQNGNWFVAIGSGSKQLPKSDTDIARSSTGYIYLLNLKTGALVKKIGLDHNAILSDILAIDADKDYQSEKIYFGTAHKPVSSWAGKVVGLAIPTDVTGMCGSTAVVRSAADCGTDLKTLFTGNYPFTASPDAARDTSGNVWVYAGAGKYYSDVDETDSTAQVFLGIKDKASGITYPLTIATSGATDITDRTGFNTEGTVTGTTQECLYNGSTNSFGLQTLVTSITPTSATPASVDRGWYVSLSSGERVITRPLAVGGLVDFLTYKPSPDVCSYGGDSYLYSLGYTSGVAPATVAIRSPETTTDASTGSFSTTGTVRVAKGILLGPGAPPTGEAIIIPPPKEGQESLKKKIQIATGVIVEAENAPVTSVVSKIVHWLKK